MHRLTLSTAGLGDHVTQVASAVNGQVLDMAGRIGTSLRDPKDPLGVPILPASSSVHDDDAGKAQEPQLGSRPGMATEGMCPPLQHQA
jgi:hypothetical protein